MSEPAPAALRHALREVIGRCLYGVDVNPMAVELCKVSLWMEAVEPGKPLDFLDHHIKCGNSLLGRDARRCWGRACPTRRSSRYGRRQGGGARDQASQQEGARGPARAAFPGERAAAWQPRRGLSAADRDARGHSRAGPRQAARVRAAGRAVGLRERRGSTPTPGAPRSSGRWMRATRATPPLRASYAGWSRVHGVRAFPERRRCAASAGEQRFFHWHLEFPDVFDGSEDEGFDCVLGNPPWERSSCRRRSSSPRARPRSPTRPTAPRASGSSTRCRRPTLRSTRRFSRRRAGAEAQSKFLRDSGRFPLTARGDINIYSVFAENDRHLIAPRGRAGIIVPTGIATDDTNKTFFGDLVAHRALASLYDFENRRRHYSLACMAATSSAC